MIEDASRKSVTLLLTTVFIGLSAGDVVDWISAPADHVRPLNGTVTFDCLVRGVGNRTVLWSKTDDDGTSRMLFINETPFDAPARYRSSRAQDGSGYRLIIVRIDANDDADYVCEIQRLVKESAHLTVLGIVIIYSSLFTIR